MTKRSVIGICASGPSLTADDVRALRAKVGQLIVINTTFKLAPNADHLYACDFKWWQHYHKEATQTCASAALWSYEIKTTQKFPNVKCVQGSTTAQGLNRAPFRVNAGGNSGHQALNLAYHLGATRVILLGYDMQGNTHWHGDHPQGLNNQHGNYPDYRRKMEPLARDLESEGVEVLNATRNTALTCFERVRLEDL